MNTLETIGYWAGYCYAAIFIASYIPQFFKTLYTKKVDDLSLNMFVLTTLGYTCLFLYQFHIGFKTGLMLNVICGGSFSVYFVWAILKYRNPIK